MPEREALWPAVGQTLSLLHVIKGKGRLRETIVTNVPEICAFIIGFSFTVWTVWPKMRPLVGSLLYQSVGAFGTLIASTKILAL